ncbi:hypothetical protein AVEN_103351-1 [Araneus ventricosus]|uniref:Uncharacterized protein n=1 Tax=Araneus ventricosus TaxID=182803 RepID=A0A4Y2KAG4_ARAVE|nr:hypothetical protein AVEN_103351-1 [Araneus ventricosus]
MDFLLFTAIFLQILFCIIEAAYFGGFLFVLPISGYAILGELVLYALSLMLKESMDTDKETCAPEVSLAMSNMELRPKAPPLVRNALVWSYCKRLGIDAKLMFPNGAKITIVNGVPFVNSKEVYMFCQALKLKADMLL